VSEAKGGSDLGVFDDLVERKESSGSDAPSPNGDVLAPTKGFASAPSVRHSLLHNVPTSPASPVPALARRHRP
jgi:hypothetical protein